jgi:hypothetical protein
MPINVRLYFADGMPAREVLRIIWQMSSICLLRSGSFASRIAGFSLREISLELSGSGTMSSVMPNDSTRSRRRVSASTDHAASSVRDGNRLQMRLTPNPASTRRMESESPCCVPTFMSAFGREALTLGCPPSPRLRWASAASTRCSASSELTAALVSPTN